MPEKIFPVTVESVGAFTFRHRTMREELRIGSEFSRLTEGVEPLSEWFSSLCEMVATLKVLTVDAPDEWAIDEMDPLDPDSYKRLTLVYSALREKETFFRKGRGAGSEAPGPGTAPEPGVVVQGQVSPAAG